MSDTIGLESTIDQIIVDNERLCAFWTKEANGWAPGRAETLLENSRMDRLVSLSHTLRLWTQPCADENHEGRLILAWANLGILVEGTMTWFVCVYESDYSKSPMKAIKGFDLDPNQLRFEELIRLFRERVWTERQIEEWDDWLTAVRNRRNAVHAFNYKDIGTWSDWSQSVVRYHDLIADLDSRVPYPDASDYYR